MCDYSSARVPNRLAGRAGGLWFTLSLAAPGGLAPVPAQLETLPGWNLPSRSSHPTRRSCPISQDT